LTVVETTAYSRRVVAAYAADSAAYRCPTAKPAVTEPGLGKATIRGKEFDAHFP
jgi:hypothetical protein